MLRPVDEIARRRNRQPRDVAVPLRVGEHIGAVVRFDDPRILDAARPLILPLRVGVGIQHRRAAPREPQAIAALGQPQPRGVPADLLLAARIFRAIEHEDFSVLHDGGRIEGGVFLPRDHAVRHR